MRMSAHLFAIITLLTVMLFPVVARAESILAEREGLSEFKAGEFDAAAAALHDDYRKGVALYRAGNYAAAAEAFARSERESAKLDGQYNAGNARFMQQDYAGAIANYEAVLKTKPDHQDAQHNLELAKKRLQQQQQQQKKDGEDDSSQSTPDADSPPDEENPDQQDANQSAENPKPSPQNQDNPKPTPSELDKAADHMLDQLENDPSALLSYQFQRDEQNAKQDPNAQGQSYINPW